MSSFRERLGVTITGFLIPLSYSTMSKIFFCVFFIIFALAGYILGAAAFVLNEVATTGELMLEGSFSWGVFSASAVLMSWFVRRVADNVLPLFPSNTYMTRNYPPKGYVTYQRRLKLLTVFGGALAGLIAAVFSFFPYTLSIIAGAVVGWVFAELSERYYY